MRVAVFVVVVAAHVIMLVLFLSLRRQASQDKEEEPEFVSIFLPPSAPESEPVKQHPPQEWQAPGSKSLERAACMLHCTIVL